MSELSIPERVAAGAAWLDEKYPAWIDRIDVDTLNVASPCKCILGQAFGDYDTSPYDARWSPTGGYAARDRGFNVDVWDEMPYVEEEAEYADLTAEWRRLIESRRAGAVS